MEEAGKRYLSTTEILPSGSRLFLFTDGLVEAVPAGGGLPYQESRLNKALVRFRQEAPAAFLDRILADLQEHRNSDRFEDDVCMICVDVK